MRDCAVDGARRAYDGEPGYRFGAAGTYVRTVVEADEVYSGERDDAMEEYQRTLRKD